MLTAGVDLAAEPKKTAMALVAWSLGQARVVELQVGVRDEQIVDAAADSDCVKLGIDCPLGWPVPFVEFVGSHHDGHVVVPAGVAGLVWRRRLAFRTTDAAVRELTGQRLIPLSVAADRIGHTAMRCAALLATLASRGLRVERAGTGLVVEVYPAASLWSWQLPHRGYKGGANTATRHRLVRGAATRRAMAGPERTRTGLARR